MKRTSILLTVLVVLLAGCTGAVTNATPNAEPGDSSNTNSVTASGSESVTAAPDVAVVVVGVEATADSAAAARSQVAADADSLRTALADAGYEVETVDFRLAPEYDHSAGQREQVGYRAVHVFEFEAEPDAAGDAVDLAVDNGATAVQNVRFELSDDHRAELRQQALQGAVNDARSDAEAVAGAANRSIGTELSMQVGSSGYSPYEVRYTADAAEGGTSFEPGPVSVTASVTVTYELE
ncbi:SIMPL domain-containing protein [Halorarum halophilum]|uniref:SIMPL domain-containing protein n=1 Tax=Halorarum halophilum TaxID=2743090 RepID=A0A7D5KG40_9EURY|nr:SIMPL domain-containing protein [Halobaculum halophilum]QLG28036.1 SIMPL domain-containing protein [Halobaculum halophilum]